MNQINIKIAIFQLIWSPNLCIFTKKSSLKGFNENQYDIYERCFTFDGPEHFSKTSSFQEKELIKTLKAISNEISAKVTNISYEMFNINRMVLYFKRDIYKNLYFLYATSARLIDSVSFSFKNLQTFLLYN